MDRLGIGTRTTFSDHVSQFGDLPRIRRHSSGAEEFIAQVERSGLRGRGGGWFPTATKLRAVVDSASRRRPLSSGRRPVVIANGMEGEPASGKDHALLQSSPHLVLDGISLATSAVGATDAFIAVHRDSPVIQNLIRALDERTDPVTIQLVTPPARYVASEESALAHWVGSGVATPVFPDRPFQKGARGRPTLVQNVETLAHLALIGRYGGDWFAQVGSPSAPGTTLVTVGGAVCAPGVVEVATGTPVAEIIGMCGGATGPAAGYLTGGYGGGWVPSGTFEGTGWDPAAMRAAGAVIGASVLWVVGRGDCPLGEIDRVTAWLAGESAGQCGPCVFGLPSVSDDVHQLAIRNAPALDLERLAGRLRLVTNRGGCKHPDGVARFVSTGLSTFSEEVALHLEGRCSAREGGNPRPLPVPAARRALVDVGSRDFV